MSALRVVAYLRVSTQRQADEGLSLGAQEERLRAICEAEGWDLIEIVVEAESGAKKREKLEGIFDRLGTFDILLIDKPNRFARKLSTSVVYKERLEEAGGQLWSREPRLNLSTGMGRQWWNIAASFAEAEREEIGKRVSDVSLQQRKKGEHNGQPPYGYERPLNAEGRRKGVIVPHPLESLIVVRIFTAYRDGDSGHVIARDLHNEGVPTKAGGEWVQGTVSKILCNPIYKGMVRRGDKADAEWFPGLHTAIVSDELWDACAERRERLTRTKSNGGGRRPNGDDFLFLNGALRCHCGGGMVTRTNVNQKVHSERYFCNNRRRDRESCDQEPIDRAVVDAAAYAYFEKVGLDLEATRADLTAAHDAKVRELAGHVAAAEREAQEAQVRLDRIKGYFHDGDLSPAEWREQRDELEPALAAADAQLAQRRDQLERVELSADLYDAESDTLRALAKIRDAVAGKVADAGSVRAAREAIGRLFSEFRIHRADSPYAIRHADLQLGADLWIEPVVRSTALESAEPWNDKLEPFITPATTPLAMRKTTDAVGFWT